MKIVINKCYGGYGLSEEAYKCLNIEWDRYGMALKNDRTNSALVECVEKLGSKANGKFAELQVVEIPDSVEWLIEEYDGNEWIAEKHRTWE